MTPELQKQLSDLISKLSAGLDVASNQLPALVQEKIWFGRLDLSLDAILYLILLLVCMRIVVYARRRVDTSDEIWWLGVWIPSVIFVPLMFVWLYDLDVLLQAWIAPRVYVLEWLKDFIK